MKTVRVFIERGKDGTFGAYMPDDNNLSYGIMAMERPPLLPLQTSKLSMKI